MDLLGYIVLFLAVAIPTYIIGNKLIGTKKGHKPINLGGPSVFIYPDVYGDIPVTGLTDEQSQSRSSKFH